MRKQQKSVDGASVSLSSYNQYVSQVLDRGHLTGCPAPQPAGQPLSFTNSPVQAPWNGNCFRRHTSAVGSSADCTRVRSSLPSAKAALLASSPCALTPLASLCATSSMSHAAGGSSALRLRAASTSAVVAAAPSFAADATASSPLRTSAMGRPAASPARCRACVAIVASSSVWAPGGAAHQRSNICDLRRSDPTAVKDGVHTATRARPCAPGGSGARQSLAAAARRSRLSLPSQTRTAGALKRERRVARGRGRRLHTLLAGLVRGTHCWKRARNSGTPSPRPAEALSSASASTSPCAPRGSAGYSRSTWPHAACSACAARRRSAGASVAPRRSRSRAGLSSSSAASSLGSQTGTGAVRFFKFKAKMQDCKACLYECRLPDARGVRLYLKSKENACIFFFKVLKNARERETTPAFRILASNARGSGSEAAASGTRTESSSQYAMTVSAWPPAVRKQKARVKMCVLVRSKQGKHAAPPVSAGTREQVVETGKSRTRKEVDGPRSRARRARAAASRAAR